MAGQAGNIVIKISVQSREMTAGLRKAQGEMKKTDISTRMMGISIQRAGASIAQGAKTIGRAFTVMAGAIAGSGLVAVKIASDWESAFTDVSKVLDPLTTDIRAVELGLLELSKTTPLATEELAEVAASAGRLGISGEKNILKFTKVMSAMGVTTNLTAEEAGDAMARFANITKMPIDEMDKLGSTIVNLGNNLPTTEKEILSMGRRMASAGHQAGLSEAEIMGMAGAISATGVSAERGGTNFSKFLRVVTDSTRTGGKELDTFAKVSGVTSAEFKKHYEKDASGAIQMFLAGLGGIDKAGGSTSEVLKDLGLNGAIMNEILGNLSGNTELVEQSLGYANKGWEENSALMKEAEQRYGTFASLIQLVKNRFKFLGIMIGTEIMNVLSSLIKALMPIFNYLDKLAQMFVNLSEPVKKAIVYVGMALSALFAFGAIIMFVIAGIASLVSIFGLFLAGASAIGLTLGGLVGIVVGVVGVVAVLIGAVVGIVSVLALVIARSEKFRDAIVSAFTGIKDRVMIIVDGLKRFAFDVWGIITDFWENDIGDFIARLEALFKPMLDKISEFGNSKGLNDFRKMVNIVRIKVTMAFKNMMDFIGKAMDVLMTIIEDSKPVIEGLYKSFMIVFDGAKDIVSSVMPIIGDLITSTLAKIKKFWDENGEAIMAIVEKVFPIIQGIIKGVMIAIKLIIIPILHSIKNIFTGVLDVILGVVAFFASVFTGDWKGAFEAVKQIIFGVFKVVIGWLDLVVFRGLLGKGKLFLAGIKSVFSFKGIVKLVKGFGTLIKKAFTAIWGAIKKVVALGVLGIVNVVTSKFGEVVDFIVDIFSGVVDTLSGVWDSVVQFFKDIWSGVVDWFSGLWGDATDDATSVWDSVLGVWDSVVGFFKKVWDGAVSFFMDIWNPIAEFFSGIWEGISSVATEVWDKVTDAWDEAVGFLTDIWEPIANFFSGLWDNVSTIFENVWEVIKNIFVGAFLILLQLITGQWDDAKESTMAIWDNIIEALKNIWLAIADIFITAKETVLEVLGMMWSKVTEVFTEAKEKVVEIIMGLWDKVMGLWDTAVEYLDSKTNGGFSDMLELISGVMDTVKETITLVWDFIKDTFTNVLDAIKSLVTGDFTGMKESISKIMDDAKELIAKVWDTIKENLSGIVSKIWTNIKTKFEEIKNSIKEKITQTATNIWNKFSEMQETVDNKVKEILATIVAKFKEIPTKVKTYLTESITESRAKLTEMWTTFRDKMKEVVETVVEYIKELPGKVKEGITDMISAGKSLITGLIDGVKEKAKDLMNSVKDAIGGAIDGAKNLLNINSPSKVFMAFGRGTGEGFIRGIDGMGRKVREASESMAKSAFIEPQEFDLSGSSTRDFKSQISSAVKSSVDISDSHDNKLLSEIRDELRNQKAMIVELDGREFGRAVSEVSTDARDSAVRSGGRRRI